MTYKFQEGRYGINWETLEEYDEPIELYDYRGELWEKNEWRLLDHDDKVIKHWISTRGLIYIDVLSDNPLKTVFDMFQISDVRGKHFIELWQKSVE